MGEPDRDLRKIFDILLRNPLIQHRFADREACGKEGGIIHQHPHGHEAAVGVSAHIDAFFVDGTGIVSNKLVDGFFQILDIHGLSAVPVGVGTIVQPHRITLRNQDKGTLEDLLRIVFGKRGDLIAGESDGRILSAFACTVKEDDQRMFALLLKLRDIVAVPHTHGASAQSEAFPLGISCTGAVIENQTFQRFFIGLDRSDLCDRIVRDHIISVTVDVLRIGSGGGGAGIHGTVLHLQRKVGSFFLRAASQRAGISLCHNAVSFTGN